MGSRDFDGPVDAVRGLDLAVAFWRYETAPAALRLAESAHD
ncbi:hypothetical protein [Acrocarpospora catenulata]|nr:hypothetical protein [Acrocarpospora catenulata]